MLLLLLALSCIIRNREKEKETMGEEHFRLMRLWKQEDFDAVEAFLDAKKNEENTTSFWLLAAQIYGKKGREEFSEELLYTARSYGLRCLSQEPQFLSTISLSQGKISAQVMETLDAENQAIVECALWTSISWSLWLHEREGMILLDDIQGTQRIANWVLSRRDDPWVHYAVAISAALVPVQNNPDWKKIRTHFEKAQKLDALVEFEYFYHHHRFVEPEMYCSVESWDRITEDQSSWLQRWEESLYVCADVN